MRIEIEIHFQFGGRFGRGLASSGRTDEVGMFPLRLSFAYAKLNPRST
jgi:hypothetical protein